MPDTQYPKMAQGPAKLITESEQKLDDHGFTHPNLHRRYDPAEPVEGSGEYLPREYELTVQNVNSYRTTQIWAHYDESTDSDIP